jgi:cobyrinic acid a,c-diamide synthase
VIVEGVMGLFDGTPSAADLAERFGLPVLAVIDAHAMAGTFGALAFGLQNFRPGLPWAGVLANRVGSERHAGMLKDALREPSQWLGALPRDAGFTLPERHLGLVRRTNSAMRWRGSTRWPMCWPPRRWAGWRRALPQVRFEAR